MAKLTVDGQEKEIKYVNVVENDREVYIKFTDKTILVLEDVEVNVFRKADEGLLDMFID